MVKIEGVVAVQNHATSGSTLMQSLLDFHPRILSLPALHAWNFYIFWENHGHLPAVEMLEHFISEHTYWGPTGTDVYGLRDMGVNRDENVDTDMAALRQALLDLGWSATTPLPRKDFIVSVYVAYAKTHGRALDPQASYWLAFPIHGHTLKRALYLTEDFPKVYFLHTVREFTQNIGSHIKHLTKNFRDTSAFASVYLLEASFRQVFLEDAIHVDNYDVHGIHYYTPDTPDGSVQSRAIRLEDMHKASEETMRSVAQWMNIEWDPILIKSTYDGKLWNNRVESIRQSGLGKTTISQVHSEILNPFDRWRLKQIGRPRFLFYHYAEEKDFAPKWQRRWLMPFLLLVPFKAEWSFPHYKRVPVPLEKRIYNNRYSGFLRRYSLEKLPMLLLPVVYAIKIYKTITSALHTRKYLLEAWWEGLSESPPPYVPLLNYHKEDIAT